ncbi:MAG: HAD-IA family hydrolase [Bacteroidota bacterium]
MIDTLIFDFGDVFINLDKKGAMQNALNLFNMSNFDEDMLEINIAFEIGTISTEHFISFYLGKFPNLSKNQVIDAWNYIIKDFPKHRLDFIQQLQQQGDYQLVLLSNTNTLHIDYIRAEVPFFNTFKSCFDAFYLSHEIHLRKPNEDIFEFVLNAHKKAPEHCFFIDDTQENTQTASRMGIHTWNIDETHEDVVDLFSINAHLF